MHSQYSSNAGWCSPGAGMGRSLPAGCNGRQRRSRHVRRRPGLTLDEGDHQLARPGPQGVELLRDAARRLVPAPDDHDDLGRPRQIQLCVLVDRGGRELPIQADIIGTRVSTTPSDRVDVQVAELDGEDSVSVVRGTA